MLSRAGSNQMYLLLTVLEVGFIFVVPLADSAQASAVVHEHNMSICGLWLQITTLGYYRRCFRRPHRQALLLQLCVLDCHRL